MFTKLSSAVLCLLAAANAAPAEVDNALVARQNFGPPQPLDHPDSYPAPAPGPVPHADGAVKWTIKNVYIACSSQYGPPGVGCSYQFDIASDECKDAPGLVAQCLATGLPVPNQSFDWTPCRIQSVADVQNQYKVDGFYTSVYLDPQANLARIVLGLQYRGLDQYGHLPDQPKFIQAQQTSTFAYFSHDISTLDFFPQ